MLLSIFRLLGFAAYETISCQAFAAIYMTCGDLHDFNSIVLMKQIFPMLYEWGG